MPVNPYDDRKVSLRRPYGKGDLDIVQASYTRRIVRGDRDSRANLMPIYGDLYQNKH